MPTAISEFSPASPSRVCCGFCNAERGATKYVRGDRSQAGDCKAKADAGRSVCPPPSQRPPHLFSPEIVYILQRMKAARCSSGAEPLAWPGSQCPGAPGRVRVKQKVPRVPAQRPLASRSGVRSCEQRRGSETQHRAAKSAPANSQCGLASSPVSKQIPVLFSSLSWSYWCLGSIHVCSGSFDRCWELQGQAGAVLGMAGGVQARSQFGRFQQFLLAMELIRSHSP